MTITYRPGTIDDSHAVFQTFVASLMEYGERMNVMAITGGSDPEVLESLWQRRKSMFEFLARAASQFWVAEKDNQIIGYARSIQFNGLQELTEFFFSRSAVVRDRKRIVSARISRGRCALPHDCRHTGRACPVPLFEVWRLCAFSDQVFLPSG